MFEKDVQESIEHLKKRVDCPRGVFGEYDAKFVQERISTLQTIFEFVKNPDSHKKLIRLKRLQAELDGRYPVRVKQSTGFVEFNSKINSFVVNFELKPAHRTNVGIWGEAVWAYPKHRMLITVADVTQLDEKLEAMESERAVRKEKKRVKRLAIRESRRNHQSNKGKSKG